MAIANEPVSVIITRVVREGSEGAFEDAIKAFIPKSLAFPGHLGVHMLRPPAGERDYAAVIKFRSEREWDAFRRSPEYLAFLAEIEPLLERRNGSSHCAGWRVGLRRWARVSRACRRAGRWRR